MRSRDRTRASCTRHARTRTLLGASLGLAGLAALPVASELAEQDGAADVAPAESPTARATSFDGAAGDPGLDRWYTPAEAAELSDVETVQVTMADVEASEPAADGDEPVEHEASDDASPERTRWDRLAECESGEWVDGGESFVEGSARWDYGIDFVHEGYEQFQGGLNFHPGTWDAFRDPDMPDHAGDASREQEIVVAERVLAEQGWQAWPRCSEMVGLR